MRFASSLGAGMMCFKMFITLLPICQKDQNVLHQKQKIGVNQLYKTRSNRNKGSEVFNKYRPGL